MTPPQELQASCLAQRTGQPVAPPDFEWNPIDAVHVYTVQTALIITDKHEVIVQNRLYLLAQRDYKVILQNRLYLLALRDYKMVSGLFGA